MDTDKAMRVIDNTFADLYKDASLSLEEILEQMQKIRNRVIVLVGVVEQDIRKRDLRGSGRKPGGKHGQCRHS